MLHDGTEPQENLRQFVNRIRFSSRPRLADGSGIVSRRQRVTRVEYLRPRSSIAEVFRCAKGGFRHQVGEHGHEICSGGPEKIIRIGRPWKTIIGQSPGTVETPKNNIRQPDVISLHFIAQDNKRFICKSVRAIYTELPGEALITG